VTAIGEKGGGRGGELRLNFQKVNRSLREGKGLKSGVGVGQKRRKKKASKWWGKFRAKEGKKKRNIIGGSNQWAGSPGNVSSKKKSASTVSKILLGRSQSRQGERSKIQKTRGNCAARIFL